MTTRILAVGSNYNTVVTEDLGATWEYGAIPELVGLPASEGGPDWAVVRGSAKYLAVPVSQGWNLSPAPNQVATSADGLTWVLRSLGVVSEELSNPVWTGTHFCIVGTSNAYYSTDGITWLSAALGFSVSFVSNEVWPALCLVGTRVVGVWPNFESSVIAYSDDNGATWTVASSGVLSMSTAFLHVDGTTVRIGTGSKTLISTDSGATWNTEIADIGTGAPALYFGPLYKLGGVLHSTGYGTKIGGQANEGMHSATPAVSPWSRFTHNLNAFAVMDAQLAGVGVVVVGIQVGAGDSVPLLAYTADGLAFTPLAPSAVSLVNAQPYGQYWSGLAVYDYTPTPTYTGAIVDTLQLTDAYGTNPEQVFAGIADTLQLAVQISGVMGFYAAFMDRLVIFSDGSAVFPVSASMADTLLISDGGARGVYDPYEAINNPSQFSIDISTGAVSIYDGYDFNGYARVGQDLYGYREDGVYLIGGGSDNGEPINSGIDMGVLTLGSSAAKRVLAVYMGIDTDGEVYVRALAADAEHTYKVIKQGPVMRAVLAKGVKARAWGLKFNIEGASYVDLDLIEVETGISSRRAKR